MSSKSEQLEDTLHAVNWDFKGENTTYLTHGIHPYPAKFIPQIPINLIEHLSEPGDTVYDPFVGSGTTMVEATLAGRGALGTDVNPLSVLLSRVKSTPLSEKQLGKVDSVLSDIRDEINALYGQKSITNYGEENEVGDYEEFIPDYKKLDFWFEDFIIDELAVIKKNIHSVDDRELRDFLRIAMSAIIISISNQDSETRYTSRDKDLSEQDAFRKFENKATKMSRVMEEYSSRAGNVEKPDVRVADARELDFLEAESKEIDLVVTSPPYPNALSYHLYHRNRLVWLDFDYKELKPKEIGSHRKYSKKEGGATAETFFEEMVDCLSKITNALSPGGYCAFVIGDSIIDGEVVENNEIIKEAGREVGLDLFTEINRTIDAQSKNVNPEIGSIKEEHIVVLQKP